MLGKKPDERVHNVVDTLIGEATEVKGDIIFSGGLRIDGKIRGNVSAKNEKNSSLDVSEKGMVDGSVNVPHVTVNGTINGNLASSGTVELQASARVSGDVHYKALKMDLGASVNGNLVCDRNKNAPTRLESTSFPTKDAVVSKAK